MQAIGDIRRSRLALLIKESGSLAALNRALGRTPTDATLSQIVNSSPDSRTKKPKQMGDQLARSIEQAKKLPYGWMDSPLLSDTPTVEQPEYAGPAPSSRRIPIVGTARMGERGYYEEVSSIPGAGDGYADISSPDPGAYGLRVRGNSMAPAIRDGWYVIIEPNARAVPGEYVLVKLKNGQKMVKELLYQRPDSVELLSVNGGERHTIYADELDAIQAVSAVVSPSKWKPD